nr:uncharacterized protein LOC109400028 [Aedes albopictus]
MERKQKSSGKMEGVEEKRRKKAVRWSNNDIILLIELWEEKNDELRGARRNTHIYQEMLEALQRNGLNNITIEDIRNRIHNLTQKYRSEKKSVGTSGGSPSDWPFFDRIHAFLGKHPINNLDDYIEDSISQQEKIPEANLHEDDSGDALEDDSAAVEWLEDEFQESAEPAIPASVPSSTPKAAKPKKTKNKEFPFRNSQKIRSPRGENY